MAAKNFIMLIRKSVKKRGSVRYPKPHDGYYTYFYCDVHHHNVCLPVCMARALDMQTIKYKKCHKCHRVGTPGNESVYVARHRPEGWEE